MQQWLTGYKLKNRPYEILQILGEGGFGITYKAKSLVYSFSFTLDGVHFFLDTYSSSNNPKDI